MTAMVAAKGLTKLFGDFVAVDDLSFEVARGEVVGFLGPNGAGKSTTMKMVTGYLAPTRGEVTVAGLDLFDDPITVKSRLGYLPEGAPLYGDMSPQRLLEFVASARGLRGADKKARIDAAVARIQLESVLHQPIETLSKGFKRRVGLAQAILHDPPVLILDEPTDGLDPNQKHEVRNLISEIAADKAIVISTHILEEVDAICSRAMIIAHGKLLLDGTPRELVARSSHHNAVEITPAPGTDLQALQAALRDLPKVADVVVQTDDTAARVLVLPAAGAWLIDPVQALLSDKGWPPEQIRVLPGSMDEVFRELTTEVAGRTTRS